MEHQDQIASSSTSGSMANAGTKRKYTAKPLSKQGEPKKVKKEQHMNGSMSAQSTSDKKPTTRSRNPNLRIHHAYVHASLFKDYASINPVPLASGKWKVEINFKNNKPVTPIVEDKEAMQKITKKVLDFQKKYGVKYEDVAEDEDTSYPDPDQDLSNVDVNYPTDEEETLLDEFPDPLEEEDSDGDHSKNKSHEMSAKEKMPCK